MQKNLVYQFFESILLDLPTIGKSTDRIGRTVLHIFGALQWVTGEASILSFPKCLSRTFARKMWSANFSCQFMYTVEHLDSPQLEDLERTRDIYALATRSCRPNE